MVRNFEYPFFVIGLDIGGTKIAGGILKYVEKNQAPILIHKDKIATEAKKGPDTVIKNICSLSNKLKNKANEIDSGIKVVAIGMGCAGRIDKKSGQVMATTDAFPGFLGYNPCLSVLKDTNLPTFALNDVQSHILGETR